MRLVKSLGTLWNSWYASSWNWSWKPVKTTCFQGKFIRMALGQERINDQSTISSGIIVAASSEHTNSTQCIVLVPIQSQTCDFYRLLNTTSVHRLCLMMFIFERRIYSRHLFFYFHSHGRTIVKTHFAFVSRSSANTCIITIWAGIDIATVLPDYRYW